MTIFSLGLWLLLAAGPIASADPSAGRIPDEAMRVLSEGSDAGRATEPLLEGVIDPDRYVVGPGDRFHIQALGTAAFLLTPRVDAEGAIALGELGSVRVATLTLTEARARIREFLNRHLRDAEAQVRLLEPRRFKVFVTGLVESPGAYPATALTRASEAIALAGGVTDSASVRTIRVLRAAASDPIDVDLVAFRLGGAIENDPFLLDGDRVVVPRRARTFTVSGAVEHPGTYDLRAGETLADVLAWIRPLPGAELEGAALARFDGTSEAFTERAVAWDEAGSLTLADGDRVLVRRSAEYLRSHDVLLDGEVRFPGRYPITPGVDRVSHVIERAGGLLSHARAERIALVRGELPPDAVDYREEIRAVPPAASIEPSGKARLQQEASPDRDRITVDLPAGVDPLLADGDRILVPRDTGVVRVAGQIVSPGLYEYRAEWDYRDYVDAAGGTTSTADGKRTRLVRGEGASTEAAKAGRIEPGDLLFVPEKTPRSRWDVAKDVLTAAAQIATIVIVVDQVGRN